MKLERDKEAASENFEMSRGRFMMITEISDLHSIKGYSLWNFPGQNTGVGIPGHLPNSGIEPKSPTLQADSLPAESPERPKNTGVGSLSLLQGVFPTQELNQGLLHCRWILYQLSYQGSPKCIKTSSKC